jgi:DNA helicase-2/ATP-dependent DNA helicase PcrA
VDYGEKILPPYYEQNVAMVWNKVAQTERSIKNIEVRGVPIKGTWIR